MLLETAVGDAYGFGFEYADVNLPFNTLSGYLKHPTYGASLIPGQYTDDTQMSLALAETLIEPGDALLSKYELAKKFYECFDRDRRDGYARHFQKLLEEVKDGEELFLRLRPDSDKSGGAMRAGPLGILQSPQTVAFAASLQASVTHDTVDGRGAAAAAALMTHYFLYERGPKKDLGRWLNHWVGSQTSCKVDWNEPWAGRVLAQGWMSVRAAITAITEHDGLAAILKASVAYSGDVDTVGAIAMSAASCSKEIAKDLPEVLINGLENGKYGREYLKKVDVRLMEKMTSIQQQTRL